ncbi:hypothetical protein SKAU_G00044770 [Synaphobranchus kaupii]|uniref:Uncharacterized protein n=1 Tax=Synaphobranchus kaupii TaxID=118154 RepID=A0A9Q1G1V3_SYNKA|nr:hypothetical protein SKAU_G00044770 [Synaphobranchus kaupii]
MLGPVVSLTVDPAVRPGLSLMFGQVVGPALVVGASVGWRSACRFRMPHQHLTGRNRPPESAGSFAYIDFLSERSTFREQRGRTERRAGRQQMGRGGAEQERPSLGVNLQAELSGRPPPPPRAPRCKPPASPLLEYKAAAAAVAERRRLDAGQEMKRIDSTRLLPSC